MKFDKFRELFAVLCEVYDKTPSKGYIRLYWSALEDLADEQFSGAVQSVLRGRVYSKMPMPAEIREAALGSGEDRALLALQKVEKAIERHGAYNSVIFDDPIIPAVIETVSVEGMRGWPALCYMPEQDFKFWRKDFVKLYQAYAKNPPKESKKLAGIHEVNNRAFPEQVKAPALIGVNKRKEIE